MENSYQEIFNRLFNNYRGETVTISFSNADNINLYIPTVTSVFRRLQSNFNSQIFYALQQSKGNYKITVDYSIPSRFTRQTFRNNTLNNCMFKPVEDFFKYKQENVKGVSTKRRYNKLINDLRKYQEKYPTGLPEDKVQEFSDTLNVNIKITNLKGETIIDTKSLKPAVLNLEYINSRDDHVDFMINKNIKEVEVFEPIFENEKLIKVKCDNDEITDIYLYQVDGKQRVTKIYTPTGIYKKINPWKNELNELYKSFDGCFLCDIRDKEISNFIRFGCNTCGTLDFKDYGQNTLKELEKCNTSNIKHIDMKKSYTQGKKCPYYEGYPAKITDFRKTDKIESIGLYEIRNLQAPDFLKKLGYQSGVYTSVELKFMKDQGCTFEIFQGCWGTKMDFEYPRQSFKKYENVSLYSRHFGCSVRPYTPERLIINDPQVEKIASYNKIVENDNSNILLIERDYNRHLSHFAAFITSYMRINMIRQLNLMDKNKIARICVDGIYYEDHEFEMLDIFQKKKTIKLGNYGGDEYFLVSQSFIEAPGKERPYNQYELHRGAGGSGKTYYNLSDKGLVKPLYVSPTHRLKSEMMKKYNVKGDVVQNLLINHPTKYEMINYYNTLIIDEASMLNEKSKNIIIALYPNHKIIFMGDLDYQLPPIDNYPMTTYNLNIIDYNTNYRTQDPKLLKILNELRKCINEYKRFKFEFDYDNVDNYNYKTDIILTFTNNKKDYYTEMFNEKPKYKIIKNTRDYNNGDISFENGPHRIIQHGFTTHSIQGETYEGDIYIDREIIETGNLKLIYTAFSRARRYNQIKII